MYDFQQTRSDFENIGLTNKSSKISLKVKDCTAFTWHMAPDFVYANSDLKNRRKFLKGW